MKSIRSGLALTAVLALTFVVGCAHKQVAKVTPPPPPSAAASAPAQVAAAPAAAQVAPVQAAEATESLIDQFNKLVKDVYFDYDNYSIRPDQQHSAEAAAQFLAAHPEMKVTIEGHCDDRGSDEYNLALGDSRASALRNALTNNGAKSDQLKTVSFGKEHPFCSEDNEQCWQQNRRDHYVATTQSSKAGQ